MWDGGLAVPVRCFVTAGGAEARVFRRETRRIQVLGKGTGCGTFVSTGGCAGCAFFSPRMNCNRCGDADVTRSREGECRGGRAMASLPQRAEQRKLRVEEPRELVRFMLENRCSSVAGRSFQGVFTPHPRPLSPFRGEGCHGIPAIESRAEKVESRRAPRACAIHA